MKSKAIRTVFKKAWGKLYMGNVAWYVRVEQRKRRMIVLD